MPATGKLTLYAAVGFVLSCYALYVEYKLVHKAQEEEFTSLCDIEAIGASCSSVFQLPEGRMLSYFGMVPEGSILDVPNAALGAVYYFIWLTVMSVLPKGLKFLICSLALLSSVFMAVKLMILSELCVLCWSCHIINTRLWWDSYTSFSSGKAKAPVGADKGKAKIKRV